WGPLFVQQEAETQARLLQAAAALEELPDDRPEDIRAKERAFHRHEQTEEYRHKKQLADAWCTAFVIKKSFSEPSREASASGITQGHLNDLASGRPLPTDLVIKVERLTEQYLFFHWHLAFPEVFAQGGFDVVLGNPPWERIKIQGQEFFASRSREIATAANAAARKKLIAMLPETDPALWSDWCAASREAEGRSHFVRQSARYPLCGKGDVNTYALFAEHNRMILRPNGRAGFIVPTGIATDDTTKEYFCSLLASGNLRSLYDFQTGPETFGNLAHGAFRFSLLTVSGQNSYAPLDLLFFASTAEDLRDSARRFSLSPADFSTLNPNTHTCPTFRSRHDAELNLAIYRRAGVLWREDDPEGNPWGLRFMRMFDMANDSSLFHTHVKMDESGYRMNGNVFERESEKSLPLYEAKMVDHFDHRYASLVGVNASGGRISRKLIGWYSAIGEDPFDIVQPQYWIPSSEVEDRLQGRWDRGWFLGWRDICRSTDQRTVIASLVPRVAVGDKFLLMMPSADPPYVAALYANMCSFALDYCARQKVSGTSLKYFTMKQLPMLPPAVYAVETPWCIDMFLRDWLMPRLLELTYTAWDLKPFAQDCGWSGPPFRWDEERRFLLRCELDAAFFHLYLPSEKNGGWRPADGETAEDLARLKASFATPRDAIFYIMDAFPIVRRRDEGKWGEYRTKRVILEVYDAMQQSITTGEPYGTRLDPPPADTRVAHEPEKISL
ncbi:MAG TPA: restriction endonuclease, partial [Candidatus Tectomicrobia bacterium]